MDYQSYSPVNLRKAVTMSGRYSDDYPVSLRSKNTVVGAI